MESSHSLPSSLTDTFDLLQASVAGTVSRPVPVPARSGEPAAVLAAAHDDDVVEAVRTARAARLTVAVRSTGEASAAPAGGALVIDVSALRAVHVDPAAGTAIVGAGATWAEVVAATTPFGLAPVPGEWAHRSAVSDTLGGGMGWLSRRHGLACDRAVRYRLVTPDGLVIDVSADAHDEVCWALGGTGAGWLGVVTEVEIDLHPTRPAIGGWLRYPASVAGDVLERWRAWTASARPELSTSVVVDADHVTVHGCWVGAPATAVAFVDEWLGWRAPDAVDWGARAPGDLDPVNPVVLTPGSPETATMTNEWCNTLRDEVLGEVCAVVAGGAAAAVEVRLGGAASRTRSRAAANGRGRRDQYLVTFAGLAHPSQAVRAPFAPWVTGAAFLDRLGLAERARRVADSFGPPELGRLLAVKDALDPDHRFCHGLLLSPAELLLSPDRMAWSGGGGATV